MTLTELVTILKATGYPVAFSHFKEVPSTPFICYIESPSSHFIADNKVYHKITNVQVELYTNKKDYVAETTLEAALDANEIPYQSLGDVWIETEQLFQKIYEVELI